MENQEMNTPNDNVETTTETQSVDTQTQDSQPEGQADTTQENESVSSELGIHEAPEESETSSTSLPSIDDIVEEALSGEISEETQKIIEENGLGKHIDMLVAGNKALIEKNDNEVMSVVGGPDAYKEMQEWGRHNLSKEDQEAFNEAMFGGNLRIAKLAVQGLKAQYEAANGRAPARVIEGGGTVNTENRPFSSRHEYVKEATSFKYKSDPEYRKVVEQRRHQSGF